MSKTLKTYTATFTADGVVVGKVTFKYGDTSVKAPDVPQKNGYTAFWQPYKLDAFDITIKAVYRQNVVLGGDKITKDGTYFVQYYSTGNIEIGEGVTAVLNGENGGASGFDGLTVTADAKASLTLDNFKAAGDTTLLTLKGGNTMTLTGDSALTGTSDKKGNETPTVGWRVTRQFPAAGRCISGPASATPPFLWRPARR